MSYSKFICPPDLRISAWLTTALVSMLALWFCAGSVHAQPAGASARDALPYNDPKPLQDLLKLDDAQLKNRLSNDWSAIRQTLDRFFPARSVAAMPRGFTGSQNACLRSRSVPACRVYMSNLVEINKENQRQGSLLANPFGSKK
jgi:hypothetical protein